MATITNDIAILKKNAPGGTAILDNFVPSAKVDDDQALFVKAIGDNGKPFGLDGMPVTSKTQDQLMIDQNRLLARIVSALDQSLLDQDDLVAYMV